MTPTAQHDNQVDERKERIYIFDVEDMVVLIEHYIDRSLSFSQVANVATDLLKDIIPWMTVDYMVAVKNARDRLQRHGVEFTRSHELSRTLVFTLIHAFQRFYGDNWFNVVSRCRVTVQRNTNMYLHEDLTGKE